MQSIYFLTNNLSIKKYDTNYFPICHLKALFDLALIYLYWH